MRIGIDCRFWGIEHAGLGRYTKELVLNLLKVDKKNNYFLFLRQGRGREIKKGKRVKKVIFNVPHYSLKEQLLFPGEINKYNLDLFHFPHFNVPILLWRTPFIVTIHDLIKHFFKGRTVTTRNLLAYSIKRAGYHLVIDKAIKKAKAIIVPSYFVKDQVVVHYPSVEDKIRVIYEGVGEPYISTWHVANSALKKVKKNYEPSATSYERLLRKYKIKKPYFIYVGNVYPFKNVPLLLQAIKHFKNTQLVIVCARDVFWERLEREVKKMGLDKNVIMPGRLSDKKLAVFFKNATAFVTASLMEGFGLPGLEALAAGCPVLAARAGSLPEIYGEVATYFDPNDIDELVKKMKQALEFSKGRKGKIIKKGRKQAKRYSWRKTAKETLGIYNSIICNR